MSTVCKTYNRPVIISADADARAVYVGYRGALIKRRVLLARLAAIPGPARDVAVVRHSFLEPAAEELLQAESIVNELRQEADRNQPLVSESTDRRMLALATLEEPVNDFLAARGLTACKTT